MFIKHLITISQDELKSLTNIISQEKKLGYELIGMTESGGALHCVPYSYTLTFAEIGKKGGEK